MAVDAVTKRWIRNASDEKAVAAGCRFDEARGQHVIDFARDYLRLYEGEFAGEPLIAHDWQIDVTMRLFGWVKDSKRWGRKVRRFTRASIWIPKKNKKSPTLAWWGVYLLVADGEQGQKVFFGAKDGAQAREIAGKHAVEMVLASEALMAECSINRSLMQITHETTRSILKPMSSGDARTKESKQGINGSILIDETHVVDADFIAQINRAGISRSEPLHIEVSTAGNNPLGYGKTQYDYGKQVERGDVDDQAFFFCAYEAPQDLDDGELDKNPVKYGKLANPAWGHTVHEEEYLADYNRSKVSITELADFKMYRLNIWQKSKNPWLKSGDWKRCEDSFALEQFASQPCWAGLDLSKTCDMTALVLMFKGEEGEFFQLPYFWLPERTAVNNNHLVPFLNWANSGYVKLIPGEVIEQEYIEDKFAELNEIVRIQNVQYDPTYAEDLTMRLERDHGIPRLEFRQTTQNYAGPVKDYERLVIQGKLKHPNHPILNWQAGHCETFSDSKGRTTLVKPRHGDIKKIDGMVAGVMALFGAMAGDGPSIYESRGLLTIGAKEEPQRDVTDWSQVPNWKTPDWMDDED